MVEKTSGGSVWTADNTCGRREAVDERGEQPEEQPNRLGITIDSKRPRAWPKRQRGRNGERKRKRDWQDRVVKVLYTW